MRDFTNGRSPSSDTSKSIRDEAVPGKSTLVGGVRGLEAPGPSMADPSLAPHPAAPNPAASAAVRGLTGPSRLDLVFGDARREAIAL